VANKAKASNQTRRETIEAMRRQQERAERRKTMIFVAIAVVVGLALIGAVAVPTYLESRNDPVKKELASFGVAPADASCDPIVTEKAEESGEASHVAEGTKVDYKTIPPSSGKHDGQWITNPRPFYTKDDRPSVEKLVHSLEHGYTILWYDSTVSGDQLKTIENIAKRADTEKSTDGRFIAAPLDESRGKLPEGKHVALSHWGAVEPGNAYRQLCAAPSGTAVEAFIKAHPYTDAPEPRGA